VESSKLVATTEDATGVYLDLFEQDDPVVESLLLDLVILETKKSGAPYSRQPILKGYGAEHRDNR
jgi:hypothetical protein